MAAVLLSVLGFSGSARAYYIVNTNKKDDIAAALKASKRFFMEHQKSHGSLTSPSSRCNNGLL
jgi:hypothetical protein